MNRIRREKFFILLMKFSLVIFLLLTFSLFGSILFKGLSFLSFEMVFSKPSRGFYMGGGGGIFPSILGSLVLASFSTFLAFLLSLPMSIFLSLYTKSKFANFVRNFVDLLWGIPSIVYGIFGFFIMIYLGLKASLLAGIIALSFVVFPLILRSLDELFQNVPFSLKEASLSLGLSKFQMAVKVFLKAIAPGMLSAMLISFGRAIGDSASILFTAGFSDNFPTSLFSPTSSLPLVVFYLYSSPDKEVSGRAYAASLILIIVAVFISIISRRIGKKIYGK